MRLASAVLCASFVVGCGASQQTQEPTVDVLVANRNIPKAFRIDESMVRVEKIPSRWRQPKALQRYDEILGSMTAVTIFEGAQVVSTMLVSIEDEGVAHRIPKGYRSLTLPVRAGQLGDVRPQDYVDLTVVSPDRNGTGTLSKTILQNVYVLAVGDDTGASLPVDLPPEKGGAPRRPKPGADTTISLMLTPHEVPKVALADATVEIRYSVRSVDEGNTLAPDETERSSHPMRSGAPPQGLRP